MRVLILLFISLTLSFAQEKYDPAGKPAQVHLNPGPEYGDQMRMFQGIPTIERASNGRLWASWYGGGATEDPFTYVPLVTSSDNGKTWSKPVLVIDMPDFSRTWDPCLWVDPLGRLWLFYTQSYGHWDGRGGVWYIRTENPDAAKPIWTQPQKIADGVMLNKPTVISSGEWLFPIGYWPTNPNIKSISDRHKLGISEAMLKLVTYDKGEQKGWSNVFVSRDQGKTFQHLGHAVCPNVQFNEHMIVERKDKSLWMLMRTTYGIGESFSTDRGKTWTEGKDTRIRHPVTRFHIRRLKSGALLMVRHHPTQDTKLPVHRSRSHLTAYVSNDDGKTWEGGLLLDERVAVSYPDSTQAPDGRIFVIYDHNRHTDREILMASFTEEDIRKGDTNSSSVVLKQLINKGAPDKGGFSEH